MQSHLHYLWYVLRHKWYVARFCFAYGLYWEGLVHDWSKFLPDEWFPYAHYFYGGPYLQRKDIPRDFRGMTLDKESVQDAFDLAWLKHQHRHPHHWQHWILREDDGGVKILPMPWRYVREMLADWKGAGMALGKPDTKAWYLKNKDKMQLHPWTRSTVEQELGIITHEEAFRQIVQTEEVAHAHHSL